LSSRKFEVAQIWNTKMQPKYMCCGWDFKKIIHYNVWRKKAYLSNPET
jgi:hypothetical protein